MMFPVMLLQRKLPHLFEVETVVTLKEMATAIKDMHIRGAGLVGASAACGMHLAAREVRFPSPLNMIL